MPQSRLYSEHGAACQVSAFDVARFTGPGGRRSLDSVYVHHECAPQAFTSPFALLHTHLYAYTLPQECAGHAEGER